MFQRSSLGYLLRRRHVLDRLDHKIRPAWKSQHCMGWVDFDCGEKIERIFVVGGHDIIQCPCPARVSYIQ